MKLKITLLTLLLSGSLMAQDRISEEFSDIGKISMSTSSGDCVVKMSNNAKITVEVVHYYGEDYNPTIEKQGNTLRIKELSNRNYKSGWSERSPKWTLTVPNDVRIKFSTGSGDFMASDIDAEIDINTGSGDIELGDVKGDLTSNTGSGDFILDGFDGEFSTNVGSGDVEINDAKGDMNINCGSGGIDLRNVSGGISANVGSGDIEAMGVTVAEESSFNSGSGDVEVELASSPSASISVNSGSGDADLDYNGNAIKGLITMKANKRRGEIRAPFDFDTSEEIENYNQVTIKKTKKMDNTDIKINIGTGSGTASISK